MLARTLEQADEAARQLKVTYAAEPFVIEMDQAPSSAAEKPAVMMGTQKLQLKRGDLDQGRAAAVHTVEATYRTSYINHNPMEPHATVARWEGDELTLFETTQWVMGLRSVVSKSLDLRPEQVHIVSPYVGGGFGSKGFSWPHSIFAAVAAKQVQRPVKLVLSRAEMFTNVGRRGVTEQKLLLGADAKGQLTVVTHTTRTPRSIKGSHLESCGLATAMLYSCPNLDVSHEAIRLNIGSPTPTRAPGEAPGTFALESAMDELALKVGIDPIELRLRNYASMDEQKKLPFSSKQLVECYTRGAEMFSWKTRNPEVGSMREGNKLIGWGVATATYPANKRPSTAAVRIMADGSVVVRAAAHDLGTGTYTTLAQVAASELNVPIGSVHCDLGNSDLPMASVAGGSSTSASVAPPVREACLKLRKKLGHVEQVPTVEAWKTFVAQSGQPFVEEKGGNEKSADENDKVSAHSFGAQFVEVEVDAVTREIRIRRALAVIDAGKIMNALTAKSQIQGGMIWGIGMALLESTELDPHSGGPITQNLADYLVPCNADIPDLAVEFIEVPDYAFNPLGVRGIGEIGITGITAAIANAVHHATGIRVRKLPLTLDKLMEPAAVTSA